MFNKFFSENHAVYEVMWENVVQTNKPQIPWYRNNVICMLDN